MTASSAKAGVENTTYAICGVMPRLPGETLSYVPEEGSWAPSLPEIGHSSSSAPMHLRIFFHNNLESIEEGRPDMMIVRIARRS